MNKGRGGGIDKCDRNTAYMHNNIWPRSCHNLLDRSWTQTLPWSTPQSAIVFRFPTHCNILTDFLSSIQRPTCNVKRCQRWGNDDDKDLYWWRFFTLHFPHLASICLFYNNWRRFSWGFSCKKWKKETTIWSGEHFFSGSYTP